ncbi:transposase domain-containing protein [Micromonospora vulcania]|uniref:Transposase domain-containing protein n=1 Tax=Micromonospora vulcania TaxID=1441873 RepID=A0ABW1HC58_9ACTN
MFAPGHLGELTRLVPFEMVDDVLAVTRRTQSRIRLLPARVVMYLLLAGCLFAELGHRQVWSKLTSGLSGLPLVAPTGSALRQARQRLGPQPVQALFALLRGPAVTSAAQVRWRGLLLTVVDGTFLTVAESAANSCRYAKQRGNNGGSGYPQLRLSALLSCGTRSVLDAVFDPARSRRSASSTNAESWSSVSR